MTLSFAPDRIEMWPLAKLQPYARNAKAHGADQVAKIAASMAEFGWTVPCLVAEDGELIAGHGRVLAATQLGLTEAPVIVLGHLTEAQRRAYRIADNKLTELGTWDEALLSAELNDLLAEDFDLSLVGFSDGELDKLLAYVPAGDGQEGGVGGSVPPVTIPEPPRNPASRIIERAEVDNTRWIPPEWQDARLAVLEALDRKDEAQAFRWACFERDLSGEHLRAYLKRLPDFDNIEAEERAMAHAAGHADPLAALAFFLNWPSLGHAARLLIDRQDEVDGDHYELLAPAAETMAEKHPLAATVALRAMIDFTLTEGRQKRYGYAAQHMTTCADLAGRIEDFGAVQPHATYVAQLRAAHGKKSGFWGKLA